MSTDFREKLLLYRLTAKHDPEAYAELYDKYVKQIYRFIYFKVSSVEEAEDLTSEVFLKAWNYLQTKSDINSFSGLLYRIARNCIVDLYRRKGGRPTLVISEEKEYGDAGKWCQEINNKVESERVFKELKKLKQEYQEVITLRYVDELSIDEIAEITGKGRIAVRVTLHRALKRLKIFLE